MVSSVDQISSKVASLKSWIRDMPHAVILWSALAWASWPSVPEVKQLHFAVDIVESLIVDSVHSHCSVDESYTSSRSVCNNFRNSITKNGSPWVRFSHSSEHIVDSIIFFCWGYRSLNDSLGQCPPRWMDKAWLWWFETGSPAPFLAVPWYYCTRASFFVHFIGSIGTHYRELVFILNVRNERMENLEWLNIRPLQVV